MMLMIIKLHRLSLVNGSNMGDHFLTLSSIIITILYLTILCSDPYLDKYRQEMKSYLVVTRRLFLFINYSFIQKFKKNDKLECF